MKPVLIFDVKRYAINDGPGIRATIFFKGCPLSCKWCHNPESISPSVQKLYTSSKCIGARECIKVCDQRALTLTREGIITDPERCNLCGACADACPSKAIEMSGEPYSIEDILKIINKERVMFDHSGGGVTFSGGEPLMHHKFLIELLDTCGREGIHRTVDTTGFTSMDILLEVAKRTDHFLFDIKLMDAAKHKHFTGVSNKLILKNLRTLAATGASINIRVPFIKGVNSDEDNIRKTAEFISSLAGDKKSVNLLPYHNIAQKKYEKLGMGYDLNYMREPSREEQEHALSIFQSFGIEAIIGG
ncbi:MAG: glycyl-radical enzyme activating protein [Anaerolineales bacterium]